jgi:hypothetical protein
MVSLTELLPNIHQLTFDEKVKLLHILTEDIEVPQAQTYFEPYKTYYLHTPQFEAGAGEILMQALVQASPEN